METVRVGRTYLQATPQHKYTSGLKYSAGRKYCAPRYFSVLFLSIKVWFHVIPAAFCTCIHILPVFSNHIFLFSKMKVKLNLLPTEAKDGIKRERKIVISYYFPFKLLVGHAICRRVLIRAYKLV